MSRRETQIQRLASKLLGLLGLVLVGTLVLLLLVPTPQVGAQGTSASSPPLTGTPGQIVYFGTNGTPVSSTKLTFDGNCLTLDTGVYCQESVSLADPGDGLRVDDLQCNTIDPGTPAADHYYIYYKCGTGYIIKDSSGTALVLATGSSLASYLPLTAGSGAKLTGLLYTRGVLVDQDGDAAGTTCLYEVEADDRIFGDKDCDGTKDPDELFVDLDWNGTFQVAGTYLTGLPTNNTFTMGDGTGGVIDGPLTWDGTVHIEPLNSTIRLGSNTPFARIDAGNFIGDLTGSASGSATSLTTADTNIGFPTYSNATAATHDTGTLVCTIIGRSCRTTFTIAGVAGNCATDYNTAAAVPFFAICF